MISIVRLAIVAFAGTAAAGPLIEATPTKPGECTTTVTEFDAGFTGDYKPTGTITLYNSTVTVAKPTDCHGCNHITSTTELAPWWGGIGPQVEKVILVYATTPTTVSTLVCATSTATPTDVPGPGPSK
ncbi:hypothetical protein CI238_01959 [Colletotrichum incanum]|uniref:Uncharacterized protein n=1 Tax=Colletotrichum incanum TaxID=1573173 RepID=A0A161W790_COLIC|nr:hypothetical protein CI238_01959 [Colletotrichum incanum]OHW95243.1 hypothetical protein CSPAE12_06190 [Colletotrichum incanum]